MSTVTRGRHAFPAVPRTRRFGLFPRRSRASALPRGEHPYPEAAEGVIKGVSPVTAVPPVTGTPCESVEAAHEDTRAAAGPEALADADAWYGLTEMDIPPVRDRPFVAAPPAAFLRAFQPDGTPPLDAFLTGEPRFLRLAACSGGQVAEVLLGDSPDGAFAFAGDRAALDAVILALLQARDTLVYAGAGPAEPEAETGREPEVSPGEPAAAEAMQDEAAGDEPAAAEVIPVPVPAAAAEDAPEDGEAA